MLFLTIFVLSNAKKLSSILKNPAKTKSHVEDTREKKQKTRSRLTWKTFESNVKT